jgi:hypothetical protein
LAVPRLLGQNYPPPRATGINKDVAAMGGF